MDQNSPQTLRGQTIRRTSFLLRITIDLPLRERRCQRLWSWSMAPLGNMSVRLSVCLAVYVSLCLYLSLSVSLFVTLCVSLFVGKAW